MIELDERRVSDLFEITTLRYATQGLENVYGANIPFLRFCMVVS